MIGLTPRQAEILTFLRQWPYGWSPSYDEIMAGTGAARGSVQARLRALQDRGYIRRVPGRVRGIELTEAGGEQLLTINGQRFRFIPKSRAATPAGSAPAVAQCPAAAGCRGEG